MAGHTMDKAVASEAAFIMYAAKSGWEVAKPIHHSNGYDFVVRMSGPEHGWSTVQVKTAYSDRTGRRQPTRAVSLRRCNEKGSRPYHPFEFNWLFVVDDKECWFIPWAQIEEEGIRSTLTVSSKKWAVFKVKSD